MWYLNTQFLREAITSLDKKCTLEAGSASQEDSCEACSKHLGILELFQVNDPGIYQIIEAKKVNSNFPVLGFQLLTRQIPYLTPRFYGP